MCSTESKLLGLDMGIVNANWLMLDLINKSVLKLTSNQHSQDLCYHVRLSPHPISLEILPSKLGT